MFMPNKKGQMTVFIITLILACLFTVIGLLVMGIVIVKMNTYLDQDIDIGQVNLQDVNDQSFGIYTTMFLDNADWWGLCVIFGMIFGLFLSAYFMRNTFPKWGIILDIFFIFSSFIVSIYISSTYLILLDALSSAGETFLEDYATKTSLFVKNLPIFTVIVGVIMMVLFHSSIPKRTEEEAYQSGGYLQGAY